MPDRSDESGEQEYWAEVRQILLKIWDPILVSEVCEVLGLENELDDEYDDYVGPVHTLLMGKRASAPEIEDWLNRAISGETSMPLNTWVKDRSFEAADALVALRSRVARL